MLSDRLNRPLRDLRISVTDRCNIRCTYCMPLAKYAWLNKKELLSFEEITRLARLLVGLGVEKIRLTGGEPLVRQDLDRLIRMLAALEGVRDLALTSNGILLADQAPGLRAAGLQRLNISLDTLQPDKFQRISQRGGLERVLAGIEAARRCGFDPIKINMVVERGVNDDEILDLVEFCRGRGLALRFIEYMDVGNANDWKLERTVSKREIQERLGARFALRSAPRSRPSDTAVPFAASEALGDIGTIASVTEPFCGACSRARLTADGRLVTCLFSSSGTDLKTPLRAGAGDAELVELIERVWRRRDDRYSEQRLEALASGAGYDPHRTKKIEMISLGG
ncbi:MAG TPA: GTP 3',8-cyclase MoaA [Acidobacteriota bacterium]